MKDHRATYSRCKTSTTSCKASRKRLGAKRIIFLLFETQIHRELKKKKGESLSEKCSRNPHFFFPQISFFCFIFEKRRGEYSHVDVVATEKPESEYQLEEADDEPHGQPRDHDSSYPAVYTLYHQYRRRYETEEVDDEETAEHFHCCK